MTNTKTIILDLDGVLVNFYHAAMRSWGLSPNLVDYDVSCGWDIIKAMNVQRTAMGAKARITGNMFWGGFDKEFWATLPWYDHARTFLAGLERLVGQENITLCTSAAYDSDCAGGKVEWINTHMKNYRRQYFIGCQKFRLANPNAILIDDADHNVRAFRAAGGSCVLVPRPWNSYKTFRSYEPYVIALERVEEIIRCS